MTTAAENELLTRVGPGTPMGEMMRNYWMMAAKSDEVEADGDPVRLRLLCENLIAFRDSDGKVGIMDHRCPHRCASLFFGRNEEGGIRCVYHGWKFDVDGNCLDMANVPPHQDFKHKVHAKAYKTAERNGMIWVFMGDQANVPDLPPIEPMLVPEGQNDIVFFQRDCNWLQAVEGELDTSHLGILHLGSVDKNAFDEDAINKYAVTNRAPEYVVKEQDYGMMYAAYRPAEEGENYWRLGQYLFPFWTMPPINHLHTNVLTHNYVPIDDHHTMVINVHQMGAYGRERGEVGRRVPGAQFEKIYEPRTTDWMGRWRLRANKGNDYEIDRDIQRLESYTGVQGIPLQDQVVTESMGEITDRTFEQLAPSDVMINRTRRWLIKALKTFQETGELPASAKDPSKMSGVRGGNFTMAEDGDWLEAYEDIRAAAPLKYDTAEAAE
jgi:phthalate 4,5-dioxygenase oxygenase subunit